MSEPKEPKRKWTSQELLNLLRQRFPSEKGEYAFFTEVGNGTGFGCNTWVDAVVLSLWPSNGLHRMAFEVKVSRSDFLREIANPSKNAAARKNYHSFWFVAPAEAIKEEELPEGSGWLCPRGDKLVIVRHAAHKTDPELTDELLAALARSMHKQETLDENAAKRKLIDEDSGVIEARLYKEAVGKFLMGRNAERHFWAKTVEDVLKNLNEATTDKAALETARHVRQGLDNFQRKILDLVEIVGVFSSAALDAKDEMGLFVNTSYGLDPDVAKKSFCTSKTDKERSAKVKSLLDVLAAYKQSP